MPIWPATWDDLSEADNLALRDELDKVAPRLGRDVGPYRVDLQRSWAKECGMQTLSHSRLPDPVDANGAPPLLLIGNTGDIATPIEAARAAARDLDNAVLVTVDSPQHTSFFPAVWEPDLPTNRCLLDTIETYLIYLGVPASGASCSPAG